MRRGSHGCACLDASPTTASARKLNNLAEVAGSLPCSSPLTSGQHAATAPPTATPRRTCYKRSSGVLAAGEERVSGPRHCGLGIGRGVLGRCLLAGLAIQRDRPPAPPGQREKADRDRDRGLGGEDQVGDEVQHTGERQGDGAGPAIASRLPLRTIASLSPSRKRRRW